MTSKLRFCFAVSVLTIGPMLVQGVAAQEDASDFLATADQEMRARNLHLLHISGAGW